MNVDQIAFFDSIKNLFSSSGDNICVADSSFFALCENVERICVGKNHVLQKEGERAEWLYFIFRGVVREHLSRADGKDITSDFHIAPAGVGSLHSYCSGTRCDYSITTATNVVAFRIECKTFNTQIGQHADLCRWYAGLVRNNYIQLREHVFRMNCTSSEDRLRALMKRSPELISTVLSSHVASYLNMTPVHFSRAKNNVLNELNDATVKKRCESRNFS